MSKITKTLKTLTRSEDWKGIRKVARAAFGMAGILECDLDDIKQELALQLVVKPTDSNRKSVPGQPFAERYYVCGWRELSATANGRVHDI